LSSIESISSKTILTIINSNKPPVPISKEHVILLRFIILLHNRTLYSAEEFDEISNKLLQNILSKDSRFSETLNSTKIVSDNPTLIPLQVAEELLPIAFDLKYKLLLNNTENNFITSDNPVIFYNQFLKKRKAFGGIAGLGVKGLEILFPISPRHYIIFYDGDIYRVGESNDSIVVITEKKDVNALNILQYLNARENLYFNHSIEESVIKQIITKSKRFRRQKKATVNEYPSHVDDEGKSHSILHIYSEDIKLNFNLSFITEQPKASQYQLGDLATHLRNKEIFDLLEKYKQLVHEGIYKPGSFQEFLRAEAMFHMIINISREQIR